MGTASLALLIVGWLLGWLLGWALGWGLAGSRPVLPTADSAVPARLPAPRVSVVIPARNEVGRLPELLRCLAELDPAPGEVVVVDDESTDGTASLARAAGVRVIPSSPPPGWTGKAAACQRGADDSTGDVLVFLDADTAPAPGAVAALAAAARGGELVSAHPRHRVERPYEYLSMGPAVVTVLAGGLGASPRWRWWRKPIAFGPAIAVRRDAYERFGGHASVRGDLVEDLALARAADRAGVPVRALLAGEQISYRMYPEGPRSLLHGWGRNLARGAGATPLPRLAATVVWVVAALHAGLVLAVDPRLLSLLCYAGFAVQFGAVARCVGRFRPVAAALHPLALGAFVVLFCWSLVLVVHRRSVPWRGRRVEVGV
ncbi:glycosyltransferase [Terrabacter sp. NPDC080008]|uniref:glycosyltransferase n=1 Tax=Terrabacter sp. NPDC080008 TaxID=3155176 RepID=UPI003450A8EC